MTHAPLRRAVPVPRFLSLPIRHALEGVSWASLSVRWIPTEEQKQNCKQKRNYKQKRDELKDLWLPGERLDERPPLHPLGGRRFPFERLYSRLRRARTTPWPAEHFAPRRSRVQSPPLP